MIELSSVTKKYRFSDIETTALRDVSFRIEQGEFISVMGPSGCGKSTLLNILGLIDQPESGDYTLFGQKVSGLSERKSADLRREHIGFIFQSFNLIPSLSVFDNVELPLIYTQMAASKRRQRVINLLKKLEINHRKNHKPQQLSGGQQQRVAIARELANNPSLILADEPTGNLDSATSTEVMKLLTHLHQEGTTIVMVTHSPYDAAFSQRTLHLLDGALLAKKPLDTLSKPSLI